MKYILFLICLLGYFTPDVGCAFDCNILNTESDPDAFVEECVNVINGQYSECVSDLSIAGPEVLILQRFYSNLDPIKGNQIGTWYIFPERFLVLGKDCAGKSSTKNKEKFYSCLALTGERSGGILPYMGWINDNGLTHDPLKIDPNLTGGMVNTYCKELNGQNNHLNNTLNCFENSCELTLGDGTKRIYKRVFALPNDVLGENLTPLMMAHIKDPRCFLLDQEITPNGNYIYFSYDLDGHLTHIEMKNSKKDKSYSWISFSYQFEDNFCRVEVNSSDKKQITYTFEAHQENKHLTKVNGSHCLPIDYQYDKFLVKKIFPQSKIHEIVYSDNKVTALKKPNNRTGILQSISSFKYYDSYTDVYDVFSNKTRYIYDTQRQLVCVERYDGENLYRKDKKYWGLDRAEKGLLLAKTIHNSDDHVLSYHSYNYDEFRNVIEEKIYGNLSGVSEVPLVLDEEGRLLNHDEIECYTQTFTYTKDGRNLMAAFGKQEGVHTVYNYLPGTNLLSNELLYDGQFLRKRIFYIYNGDGIRQTTIEDDGSDQHISPKDLSSFTLRRIKEIKAKVELPCVGLPEIIEEKVYDKQNKKEVLIKRLVNDFDNQGNLISCSTYDSNAEFLYVESTNYNHLGRIVSVTDRSGNETKWKYDALGNPIEEHHVQENKYITTTYDYHNNPIYIHEVTKDGQWTLSNTYDDKDRKINSTDRYGNATLYSYDNFDRLSQIVFPSVINSDLNVASPKFLYQYDIFGNVIKTIDPLDFVTESKFNLRGQLTRVDHPNGTYETLVYNLAGNVIRARSAEDIIKEYSYDYLGRPSSTRNISEGRTSFCNYNVWQCTSQTDPHSQAKSEYEYNCCGQLVSVKQYPDYAYSSSSETKKCQFSYDSQGRVKERKVWYDTNPNDYSIERYYYDRNDNIIEKSVIDSSGKELANRHYIYNSLNQCTEEYSLENGIKNSSIRSEYNSMGDLLSIVDGCNSETKIFITDIQNSLGQTVQQKTIINSQGIQTTFEFDALGRIVTIGKKNAFGEILSFEKYLYDLLGNKTCEIHEKIVEGKVEDQQQVCWKYGPMRQMEQETKGCNSSHETKTHFLYNSLGQLTCKTMPGGECINYRFINNRLIKIEAKPAKKELQICNTYTYDNCGNITYAVTTDNISIKKKYDAFNQVIEETIDDGEGKYCQKYKYDKKGRLKEIILPDLSKIVYHYDAISGRSVERISQAGKSVYTHTYDQRDSRGNLLVENHVGYIGSSEYEYDQCNRLTSKKNDFQKEIYVRDDLGRLLSVSGDSEKQYTYNDLSQIIYSKKSNQVSNHHYDSLNNCLYRNQKQIVSNALNQITLADDTQYYYDTIGNRAKKVKQDKEISYQSNILSQLISIQQPGDELLKFHYDPFGRLLKKSSEVKSKGKKATLARYMYLGNYEIGVISKSNDIENLKILGLSGNSLSHQSVAFELNKEVFVPFHDVEGNVQALVDPFKCEIVEKYEYSLFGETTILDENLEERNKSRYKNPWMFSEKRVDLVPDLVFFGLRFYDSSTGSWISRDPLGFADGFNEYSFVHNNPVNCFDRFGLLTEQQEQELIQIAQWQCPWQYLPMPHDDCAHCYKGKYSKNYTPHANTFGSLPTITYDDDFERRYKDRRQGKKVYKDYYQNSCCFNLGGEGFKELPMNVGIGIINGIDTNFEEAQANARHLAELAGGYNIRGVYNATHGMRQDLIEYKGGREFIATEPVRQLHKMWYDFFQNSSKDSKFLMICHSQGANHVRNALLDFPPELRKRILVVGIAPASYVYKETCGSVQNYCANFWRDFVPRNDVSGFFRERDTITVLDSHPDADRFDHAFMSPTYRIALKKHLKNYINTNGQDI